MSRESENEWSGALTGFALLYVLWRWGGGAAAVRSAFEPSLPSGVRLPETGELREVPAVKTALDPAGLPALYNRALQIVEDHSAIPGEHWLSNFLRARDMVSLSFDTPELDPEYDVPAAVFAAQSAVETNNGAACWNFNTGNVTVARGDYYRNPHAKAPLNFGNYNFPLQGAVAHVDRVKRLWPLAYRAAFSGMWDAYAKGLQDGPRKYAAGVPSETLASGLKARAKLLGYT